MKSAVGTAASKQRQKSTPKSPQLLLPLMRNDDDDGDDGNDDYNRYTSQKNHLNHHHNYDYYYDSNNGDDDDDDYDNNNEYYAKYELLLAASKSEQDDLHQEVVDADSFVQNVGLTAKSGLTETVQQFKDGTASCHSTGGHSNIDHCIVTTNHYSTDRIAEWRRCLLNRCRAALPEHRGDDRWDKQKAPGERRRRIVRVKDMPSAPPEPPPSAYIVFLGQMTTKLRHDRGPHEPHRQPLIMREVSTLWTTALHESDRQYYEDFCNQIRDEYQLLHLEYRATGYYTPSARFERPDGAGLWVHKKIDEKNELETEIASYETVLFPMRPPELDEAYAKREKEGRERRRLKLKQEAAEKRRQKNLPPIIPRRKRRLSNNSNKKEEENGDGTTTGSIEAVAVETPNQPTKRRRMSYRTTAKNALSDNDGNNEDDDDNDDDDDHPMKDKPAENETAAVATSLSEEEETTTVLSPHPDEMAVGLAQMVVGEEITNFVEDNDDDNGGSTKNDNDDMVAAARNITEI
jgi:hypothetical protein